MKSNIILCTLLFQVLCFEALGAKARDGGDVNSTFPSSAVEKTGYIPNCRVTDIGTVNIKSFVVGGTTVPIENVESLASLEIRNSEKISLNCKDDFYVFEPNRQENTPIKTKFEMKCDRGVFKTVNAGEYCDEKCNIKPLALKGYEIPKNVLSPGEKVNINCPAGQTTRTGPTFEITCSGKGLLNFVNPTCFDAAKACGFPNPITNARLVDAEEATYNSYCQIPGHHPLCDVRAKGFALTSKRTYCSMTGYHPSCGECFVKPEELIFLKSGTAISDSIKGDARCDYCSLAGYHPKCATDINYCHIPGHHPLCNKGGGERKVFPDPPVVSKNIAGSRKSSNKRANNVAYKTTENVILPESSTLACADNTGLVFVNCINGKWEEQNIYNQIKSTCKESIIDVEFTYEDLNSILILAIDDVLELEQILDFCKENPTDSGCQATLSDCKYGTGNYKFGHQITLYCPNVNTEVKYNCSQDWLFGGFKDPNHPLANYEFLGMEKCGTNSYITESIPPENELNRNAKSSNAPQTLKEYKRAKFREQTKLLEKSK